MVGFVAALIAALSLGEGYADAECPVSPAERAQMEQTSARVLAMPVIEPRPNPESIVAIEGCALYRIRVSSQGRVAAAVVVRQAGHPRVHAVAETVVKAIPFRPSSEEWLGLIMIRVKVA